MNDAQPLSGLPGIRMSHYTGSLIAIGALTASITTLLLFVLSNGEAVTLRPIAIGVGAANTVPWIIALITAGLLSAGVATALASLSIRAIRIGTYMAAVRAYTDQELRRAGVAGLRAALPLESTSHPPREAAVAEVSGVERHAPDAIRRARRLRQALVLGPEGAGKTTLLFVLARRGSAPLASVRAILGLGRVPMLVALPGLASTLEHGVSDEAYLATQFARFGSTGLAARAPRLLHRGRLTLLCDEYDALDAGGRELVHAALLRWLNPSSRLQVIVTCDSDQFEMDLDGLGPLDTMPIERLVGFSRRMLARMLQQAVGSRLRRAAGAYTRDALRAPLAMVAPLPAIARALADIYAQGQPPPGGYGALLRQALLVKRDQIINEASAPPERKGQDVALIWGAIAAALQNEEDAALPLDPEKTAGECAAQLMDKQPPLLPVSFALQADLAFDPEALEYGIQSGIAMGVLRRRVDGLGLAFTHSLMRKAAAAYWLDTMDNGLGRLNSALLTPVWIAPVALWASGRPDTVDVAQRIYRLTQSPESVASRAGLARSGDVAPVALALALAAAVLGAEPLLSARDDADTTGRRRRFAAAQELRDLLDAAAIMAADEARRPVLALALRQAVLRIGPPLEESARALLTLERLDRLARAQLTLIFGLLGTPLAIEELLKQLGQADVIIRQAAQQALIYAGPDMIITLQRLTAAEGVAVRLRASEALSLVSAATPAATEVAGVAAMSGLRSADAGQRRVAATTLGAMRATEALDALIARLNDTSLEVQIAAAHALGQLGAPAGLAALRKRITAKEPASRRAVAEALGATVDPQSLPSLLTLLGDNDPGVRAAAATALGAQGDRRAAGPLREAAQDPDPWVRREAQAAVRRLTGA